MDHSLSRLMEDNLAGVWNERDASKRMKSLQEIYTADSSLYHVGHQTTGFEAVNKSITNTLSNIPNEFKFFKLKPVVINNNIGRLIWGMGSNIDSIVATGMDIAVFQGPKIKSLYVFLD